jgi:DNA-binding ferritin-like protein
MDKIISNLLKLQLQLRILHWQTDLYSAHKAFGKAYIDLDEQIDILVELHQGKYGKIMFDNVSLDIQNIDTTSVDSLLETAAQYVAQSLTEVHDEPVDSDCLNVRDEILIIINKLRYLLTLK